MYVIALFVRPLVRLFQRVDSRKCDCGSRIAVEAGEHFGRLLVERFPGTACGLKRRYHRERLKGRIH